MGAEYEYAFAGTWNQATTVDTVGRIAAAEHVVAGIGVVHWDDMQPNPGNAGFDFNGLDPLLFAAALNFSRPLPLVVAFGAGDETPHWVYESGVPEVYTHPPGNNRSGPYPYPLDPTYVRLYKAAVTGLADHADTHCGLKVGPKSSHCGFNHCVFLSKRTVRPYSYRYGCTVPLYCTSTVFLPFLFSRNSVC
jgi:hypothetical protein